MEWQHHKHDGRVKRKTDRHCQGHDKKLKQEIIFYTSTASKTSGVVCAVCVPTQKKTLNVCTYTILNSFFFLFVYSIQMKISKLLRLLCSVASLPVPETTLVRLTVRYFGISGAAVELKSTVDIASAKK